MNVIVEKLKSTKNPAEFVGTSLSFQKLNHNSLDVFIEYDLINFYYSRAIDEKLVEKFDISDKVPKENLNEKFQSVCISVLSAFFTTPQGTDEFIKIIKNNDTIKNTLNRLYDIKDYKIICTTFVSNLAIYGKDAIKTLNIDHIIGDQEFSCLDEKDYEIFIKKINGACNYYDICTTKENVIKLLIIIENKKKINNYNEEFLNYMHKLMMSFYTTLKLRDKKLRRRILEISDVSIITQLVENI